MKLENLNDLKEWIKKAEERFGEGAKLCISVKDDYGTPTSAKLENLEDYVSGISQNTYKQANLNVRLYSHDDKYIKIASRKKTN